MSVKSHLGIDWPVLIPFSEESDEASRSRRRRRSDDGMKVVINNWREDGEKEAVDMWDNNGLSYPWPSAHRCAHVILYVGAIQPWWYITPQLNDGGGMKSNGIERPFSKDFPKSIFLPRTQQFLQHFGGDYLNNVNVGCIYKQERWWL